MSVTLGVVSQSVRSWFFPYSHAGSSEGITDTGDDNNTCNLQYSSGCGRLLLRLVGHPYREGESCQ
jgi:hypothetical protein